jgi:hypothetical protein
MANDVIESNPAAAQNSAVINPYALAELIVGRKIKWKQATDAPRLLETILQTPYEELFDPKFKGPLYTGLRLTDKMQLERARSPLLDADVKVDSNDLENGTDAPIAISRLADVRAYFPNSDLGAIEVRRSVLEGRYLTLWLRPPEDKDLQRLARVFTRDVVRTIAYDPKESPKTTDWTPPNATWGDAGRFFNETAEFFDPVRAPWRTATTSRRCPP